MDDGLYAQIEMRYTQRRLDNAQRLARRTREVLAHADFQLLERERLAALGAAAGRALAAGQAEGAGASGGLADALADIDQRQRRLLEKHGYPADYLDEAALCACADCLDTGYITHANGLRTRCKCLNRALTDARLAQNGLHAAVDEHFGTYDVTIFPDEGEAPTQRERMRMLREYAWEFAEQFPNTRKKTILLSGSAGLGKTFLMNCIARRVTERGFTAARVPSYRLVQDALKDRAISNLSIQADLLALDDLGTEPLYNNITVETLYTILNERMIGGKHTLISTNLSLKQLSERYTERIASRLFAAAQARIFTLTGRDVRRG